MDYKILATFFRKRLEDSGKDQAPDYYVYEFTDIIDSDNNKIDDKWFMETKLIEAADLKRGKRYEITLSERPRFIEVVKLPFPKEIVWDEGKVYLKSGNSIIKVNKNGIEENLSNNTIRQILRRDMMEFKKNK